MEIRIKMIDNHVLSIFSLEKLVSLESCIHFLKMIISIMFTYKYYNISIFFSIYIAKEVLRN